MPGMHPFSLRNTVTHPLARMLPIQREQVQVYRLGEKNPPSGHLADHAPMWEPVTVTLNALGSTRVRVNLQRDFTLMSLSATTSVFTARGGFRAQLYDMKKQLRFADRGQLVANIAGNGSTTPGAPFFLREPWQFDEPDSQVLVIIQNMETALNSIQLVMYGQVLRFNQAAPGFEEFPGGIVSNLGR